MPDAYEDAHPCLDSGTPDAGDDPDADGFDNFTEYSVGTDPCDNCPDTPANDALPPDAEHSSGSFRKVNGFDIFLWAQRFGSAITFTPDGKLPYGARYDLNIDGAINTFEVFILATDFNTTCS